jgi:NAD(P)-dependent dehydrogenase (short-subunit alcohol dehydrogenase family)
VVERLAGAGSTVCAAGRSKASLERLATEIAGIDTDVVDLLDPVATRTWAAVLSERHGRVDGLVHLVGGWRGGVPIEDAPLEDWDELSALLVRTVQVTTQAFAPHLMSSSRGRFVLVSSGQAEAPTHPNAAYAAAKAAAETWTLALANRFRDSGATANIVVAGAIVTPAMRAESPERDFSTFTPAEEIAEAIAYLCSDAAVSMNGQRLTLRGSS